MNWFSHKKKHESDKVEAKFQAVVDIVRGLDRREFNRLIDGMKLVWEGYDKVGQAKTREEKENADIEEAEKILEKDNGGN